jgi:tRNA U55 pseudouridine synthase TruB
MFSALHHDGKRLHELAREGVTVERAARPVSIARFQLTRDAADRQLVHFNVACSKGTYIRTLAHDLGTSLGSTAHLIALRREAIGGFRVTDAWGAEELRDAMFDAARAAGIDNAKAVERPKGGRRGRGGGGRRGGGRGSGGQ